jgi:hypothetical protein
MTELLLIKKYLTIAWMELANNSMKIVTVKLLIRLLLLNYI